MYPVVSHWAWSTDGWMRSVYCSRFEGAPNLIVKGVVCFRFEDFAGSGVVHIFAATCALIGCYIIGPRTGRFVEGVQCSEIQRHSLPLTALGGFILMFGFLAFNGGSQVTINYLIVIVGGSFLYHNHFQYNIISTHGFVIHH